MTNSQFKPYNKEIRAFIKEHSNLFWYTPEEKKEEVSEEFLIETIFNYGTMKDSLSLIKLIGADKTMRILQRTKGRRKMNYYPEIFNFLLLLSRN